MSRALAYVRVSTNEQVNGTSLDNQEKVIKRYAMDQDIELDQADIFREEGESAKFYDRPQLMAALRLLKDHKGKYDYFIVFKIDRLARDTNVHSMIKVKLKQSGVTLISATEPISDDPMGQAFEGMLSVWAQFDNQIRTARTTSGMRERTNQGAWPHDAPIGYRKTRLPSGASSIEPNHDAPMIKQLLEEFARGFLSVSDTVERGYELGIRTKTGKKRGWQSTKNILQNCLYMGYVRSDYTEGELRQGLHEPIITEETYYRIQSILLGHSRPSYKPSDVDYPLRGFVKHTCGHVLTGSAPSTGSGGRSPRYSCPVCRFSITGKAVSMMREPVHEKFMSLLSEVKPKKNTSELFRKILLQQWNNEYKEAARHTQQVNNEIAELERKRSKVLDLFIAGQITESEKNQKYDEYDDTLTELRMRKTDSEKYKEDHEHIIDAAMIFMSQPEVFWNLAPINVKKHVQSIIFPEGLVFDFDEGYRTPILAKSYLLQNKIAQMGDSESNLVVATGNDPVTSSL